MRLIGREKLHCLRGKGEQVEKWVRHWASEVTDAQWKRPADVRDQFPNAHHNGKGRFMFPVGNCKWAIHLLIAFPQGIALITDLKADDDIHGD